MNYGSSVMGPCGKVLWWWEMKVLALSNEASRELPETNDPCVETHLSCLAAGSDPRDVWLSSLPSSIHICPWVKKLAKGVRFTKDTPPCLNEHNLTSPNDLSGPNDSFSHLVLIHGEGKTIITPNMNHGIFFFFSWINSTWPKKKDFNPPLKSFICYCSPKSWRIIIRLVHLC